MLYDKMPLGPIPTGAPVNRKPPEPKPPVLKVVGKGIMEDEFGRLFTCFNYPLPEAADQAMLQRDLPNLRRDARYREPEPAPKKPPTLQELLERAVDIALFEMPVSPAKPLTDAEIRKAINARC